MRLKEILVGAGLLYGIYEISKLALTPKQREWVRTRDENRCQAPFPHKCDDEHPLQVHHILPQGYAKRVGIENPDFPENSLTLCRTAHEIVHPDVPTARHEYHQDQGSFGKLREQRTKKLDQRQIYWNSKWDRLMQVIAIRRTQQYQKTSEFPKK